ncbi:asparaginase [Pusillimonas noertemannii]|uniref:L-asparaginase n=1 Tax=Pusillimonas noertemannii TaxID=305977 RepID=A0A2U1CKL0_9BURK|nr:asparaginase [Pusillimonas noertemannii]NYT69079.1 asparaginase [Pusillimonas noertemannii]PVY61546.1 L-asparaginase [Pusillimonas noertemannii]TFL09495.1 asparaginase [Pusillimonas noertemannii]
MVLPRIKVLALGGTIAMTESAEGGVVPTLNGDMLVKAVPLLGSLADIEAVSFRQLPGAHLSYDDLSALAAAIEAAVAAGARGIVVTQGTDTIEETVFALDRLLDVDAPVIVTGAMRNPTLPGADGPANLLASVQVACSDEARGMGGLVVFSDEIHAARFVRKTHTSSTGAFSSPLAGPIGWVCEGRVRVVNRIQKVAAVGRGADLVDVAVGLLPISLGDDARMVEAACAARLAGLVVDALGGGHVPAAVSNALQAAASHMPIVLASRTGDGEVLRGTYGFKGSEMDLLQGGLVRAGWLDGRKAKVLLTLLLRAGKPGREAVDAAFRPWGGGSA